MQQDEKLLEARVEEVTGLIKDFCDQYLTQAHLQDALMLLVTLCKHSSRPISKGNLNQWAAGIVHRSHEAVHARGVKSPHYASDKLIARHFELKPIAVREQSERIRDLIADLIEEKMSHIFDDPGADFYEEPPDLDDFYPEDYEPREGEFIDVPRDLHGKFADIDVSRVFDRINEATFAKSVLKYIQEEPDYLLPYVTLADTEFAARQNIEGKLLREAYERALRLIGAHDGEWPNLLESSRFTNFHIVLAIQAQAKWQWKQGDTQAARVLLQKLLEVNPLDTTNARYELAAVLVGLTPKQWQDLPEFKFTETEILAVLERGAPTPAERWLATVEPKHPEVFAPWRAARAQRLAELNLTEEDLAGPDV